MKKIKVGQIGKGGFGKKILSKLENIDNVSVEWVYGSQDKWWESDVDLDCFTVVVRDDVTKKKDSQWSRNYTS